MKSKEFIITSAMLLLITYTLSLSLVSQAFPAGQTTKTLSSTGSIQTTAGIGIYANSQCNTPYTTVSWGTLSPGESQTATFYIKNEGSASVMLSLETANWYPETAQTYLDLSWNYNNQLIEPNEVVQIILTLSVDSGIADITSFGFDITIVGS